MVCEVINVVGVCGVGGDCCGVLLCYVDVCCVFLFDFVGIDGIYVVWVFDVCW